MLGTVVHDGVPVQVWRGFLYSRCTAWAGGLSWKHQWQLLPFWKVRCRIQCFCAPIRKDLIHPIEEGHRPCSCHSRHICPNWILFKHAGIFLAMLFVGEVLNQHLLRNSQLIGPERDSMSRITINWLVRSLPHRWWCTLVAGKIYPILHRQNWQ